MFYIWIFLHLLDYFYVPYFRNVNKIITDLVNCIATSEIITFVSKIHLSLPQSLQYLSWKYNNTVYLPKVIDKWGLYYVKFDSNWNVKSVLYDEKTLEIWCCKNLLILLRLRKKTDMNKDNKIAIRPRSDIFQAKSDFS